MKLIFDMQLDVHYCAHFSDMYSYVLFSLAIFIIYM